MGSRDATAATLCALHERHLLSVPFENLDIHLGRPILPDEHRPKVFHTRMPQSVRTFLVDGRVAGTWVPTDDGVRWEPFAELTDGQREAVAEWPSPMPAPMDRPRRSLAAWA